VQKKEFSVLGGQTSGLKCHLQFQHLINMGDVKGSDEKQTKITASAVRPVSTTLDNAITKLIGSLIAENMLPISIVELTAFLELIGFLEPRYKVPRRAMTAILHTMKEDLHTQVQNDLAANKLTKIALITDIWTSLTNEAYVSVTGSYITDD